MSRQLRSHFLPQAMLDKVLSVVHIKHHFILPLMQFLMGALFQLGGRKFHKLFSNHNLASSWQNFDITAFLQFCYYCSSNTVSKVPMLAIFQIQFFAYFTNANTENFHETRLCIFSFDINVKKVPVTSSTPQLVGTLTSHTFVNLPCMLFSLKSITANFDYKAYLNKMMRLWSLIIESETKQDDRLPIFSFSLFEIHWTCKLALKDH